MPGCHLKENTFCVSFSHVQKYLISIARDLCHLMVLFGIPTAVALSQCTGIFGCLWPRSSRVALKIIPSWQFRNSAPSSASAADSTKNLKISNKAYEKCHLIWWDLHPLVMSPWKNGHMLSFVRLVCLNMTRPYGCSSPCLACKIAPLHLGMSPSNRGLGMPFPHSQLYLTPLTLSCPLLLRSIECFWQSSAPVLFLCLSIFAKYLVGGGTVHLRHIFLVLESMGNVVFIAWCVCISTIVFWCILASKCLAFILHNPIKARCRSLSPQPNLW